MGKVHYTIIDKYTICLTISKNNYTTCTTHVISGNIMYDRSKYHVTQTTQPTNDGTINKSESRKNKG